jgi:transposase
MYSTAFYGCFAQEHLGKICRRAIPRIRPATAGSRPGSGRACSNKSLPNWARIFTNAGPSIYGKPLSMGVLPPQKRGHFVGPTKRGKGTKIMAIANASGLPVAIDIQSASPHEVKLVESTIKNRFISKPPDRIIGDKAYDSDPLDERLRTQYGTELIAPHKTNRKKTNTQDGRVLRRYRRRWKVERLFSWLHNFRRLVTRWEFHADNFLGMLQLGCIVILLRYF